MNVQEHLDKVNSLKQQIEKLNIELVEHLKTSTDLSVDERWDLYCSLESFLPVASYIQNLETLHRDVVGYDHLVHVEHRDSIVYFSYIVECLEEEFAYWFENQKSSKIDRVIEKMIEDGAERLGITEIAEYDARIQESFNAQLQAVKLEILSIGKGAYHYDW